MSFEIDKNVCEICGTKALMGILDNYDSSNNNQTSRIRYSCHDHYLLVYKKIKEEEKIRNDF